MLQLRVERDAASMLRCLDRRETSVRSFRQFTSREALRTSPCRFREKRWVRHAVVVSIQTPTVSDSPTTLKDDGDLATHVSRMKLVVDVLDMTTHAEEELAVMIP